MTITIVDDMIHVSVKTTTGIIRHAVKVLPKDVIHTLHPNAGTDSSFTLEKIPLACGYNSRIGWILDQMNSILSYSVLKSFFYMALLNLAATLSIITIIGLVDNMFAVGLIVTALTVFVTASVTLHYKKVLNWELAIGQIRLYFIEEYSRFLQDELEESYDEVTALNEENYRMSDFNGEIQKYVEGVEGRLQEAFDINKSLNERIDKVSETATELMKKRDEHTESVEQSRDGMLVIYQDLINAVDSEVVEDHVERCRKMGINFAIVEDDAEFHGVATLAIQ